MKKLFISRLTAVSLSVLASVCAGSLINAAELVPATLDDLSLATESFWIADTSNPEYRGGTFQSGSFSFANSYTPEYGSWGLYAYANLTAHEYTGGYAHDQQVMNCIGGGYKSTNYGICYCDPYIGNAIIEMPDFAETGINVKGVRIINNAWTYSAIINGDGMSGPFETGDYLKLTIKGYDKDNAVKSVDFYLADYRSENADEHYIVDDWKFCDLSGLGDVVKLECIMETTKTNNWGATTPLYFCFDNLGADESFGGSGIAAVEADMNATVRINGGIAYISSPDVVFSVTASSLDGITASAATDCGETAIPLPSNGVNILRISSAKGSKTIKVFNK